MTDDNPVVSVPADLELDERLVGLVTFRMAAWLAIAGTGGVLVALGPRPAGPAAGVLLGLAGLLGALWAPAGRPAPAWVRPILAYRRRTRASLWRWRLPVRVRRIRREAVHRSATKPVRSLPAAGPGHARWLVRVAAVVVLAAAGAAVAGYARLHLQPAPAPAPTPSPVRTSLPVPAPHDDGWLFDCGC